MAWQKTILQQSVIGGWGKSMESTTAQRSPLVLLTALYATQFIGVGFLSIGLGAILLHDGVSLDTIGWFNLLGLVWAFKFLWAPVIDAVSPARFRLLRNAGHYRAWLLVLQPCMVVSLLLLAFVTQPAQQLPLLFIVVTLFVLMSATQDIAADAISVRMLKSGKRDLGSAIQVSASYLGNIVGGAGAVIVADRWGLQAAAVLLAVATSIALIPVVLFREAYRDESKVAASCRGIGEVLAVFAHPACRAWCLVAMPLLYMGSAGLYSLVMPALVKSGRSLTQIGLITLTWASLPAIVAGLLAGWISERIGRRASIWLGTVVLAVGALVFIPVFRGGGSLVAATVGVSLMLSGYTIINVVVYTQALVFSRPEHAGSDFTLLTCISLGLSFIAAWLILLVADFAGFLVTAGLALLVTGAGALAASAQSKSQPKSAA
ncbi:MAG: MFS transporter [Propionibacteriaceae bacterium]